MNMNVGLNARSHTLVPYTITSGARTNFQGSQGKLIRDLCSWFVELLLKYIQRSRDQSLEVLLYSSSKHRIDDFFTSLREFALKSITNHYLANPRRGEAEVCCKSVLTDCRVSQDHINHGLVVVGDLLNRRFDRWRGTRRPRSGGLCRRQLHLPVLFIAHRLIISHHCPNPPTSQPSTRFREHFFQTLLIQRHCTHLISSCRFGFVALVLPPSSPEVNPLSTKN